MKEIQKIFDEILGEQLESKNLLFWFINRKFREHGIELTDVQKKEIQGQLNQIDVESMIVTLNEEQIPSTLGESSTSEILTLEWTEEEADEFLKDISESLEELIPDAIEDISTFLYNHLKNDAPAMLRERRKGNRDYSDDILRVWMQPLDLLESYIQFSTEVGSNFVIDASEEEKIEQPLVLDLLARLHARACQIANEILCLLSNGYSNGAHARWRSLHEISTVASFIADHNDDLAERYIKHEGIESYRAAIQYQNHCKDLGYPPLSQEGMFEQGWEK